MMYCPVCGAQYAASHAQCSVCAINLVPEELRGRPLDERQRKERIEVVWRGGDPLAVSEVIGTLRDAGIRHHVQPTNDHMVFELGMPRPKYAVRVFSSDAAKARELLAHVLESPPFILDDHILEQFDREPRYVPPREHQWNAASATVEIWRGEDPALAQLFEDCLHENRIGVRREEAQPGALRLLIMPADEPAAREIIREVREATPPA